MISSAYQAREGCEPRVRPRFFPPAEESALIEAESSLGLKLPSELRCLLAETDGMMEEMELEDDWIEIGWTVWSTIELVASNRRLRTATDCPSPLPPDLCVFFVNAGVDGVQFGLDLSRIEHESVPVFIWEPLEEVVRTIAPSLEAFLNGWLRGLYAI
ncbi:MAG: Cell wall assembly/cell proliferation coordinating protein [Planctomycetaceae bacterium]|nr:Cell wall assembly/cell proliferation coordinating protein [Planctomycetaceae bacterium]